MEYKLGDVVKIKYGKNQKNVKNPNGKYPILGTGGIMDYADDYLYDKPSVLIGRKGSIDKVRYIEEPFWTIDTLFYTEIDTEIVNPKYLFYKLSTIDFQFYNEGTTIPSLRTETLNKIKISLPSLKKQNKVAKILNYLDHKIEVNENVIANLEELSQTLFKRWFIDFEFPDENGIPYKSSGGEFKNSEIGSIPVRWKTGTIRDIAIEKNKKVNLDKADESYNYIGLEHMPRGSIALANFESSDKVTGNKTKFSYGDILFGKLRPYFKKVGLAPIAGVSSTDIIILNVENNNLKSYLLQILTTDEFIKYTTNTATGTRMPRTSIKQILNYDIPIPTQEILIHFERIVKEYYELIQSLVRENNNLSLLRDTLLPKLMSGEIELPDELEADKHAELLQ